MRTRLHFTVDWDEQRRTSFPLPWICVNANHNLDELTSSAWKNIEWVSLETHTWWLLNCSIECLRIGKYITGKECPIRDEHKVATTVDWEIYVGNSPMLWWWLILMDKNIPGGWTLKLLHDDHDVLIPSKRLCAQSQWKRKQKMSDGSWNTMSISQRIDRTNEFAVCFYFTKGWVSFDFQWIYIYWPPSQLIDNGLALIPYFPIQCYPNEERKNFWCKRKRGLAERNIAIRLLWWLSLIHFRWNGKLTA